MNHQGLSAASTVSFNLPTGKSLSEASEAINRAMTQLGVPSSVRGSFAGTAQVFQRTMNSQIVLILAAIATVYIVLGILYESFVNCFFAKCVCKFIILGRLLKFVFKKHFCALQSHLVCKFFVGCNIRSAEAVYGLLRGYLQ